MFTITGLDWLVLPGWDAKSKEGQGEGDVVLPMKSGGRDKI
jgi:hypothetical protein